LSSGIGVEINDIEVYASGDLGYKVGSYVITNPGGTTIDVGKYIEVWRMPIIARGNLRRYVNGEKLLSVVDVKRGY